MKRNRRIFERKGRIIMSNKTLFPAFAQNNVPVVIAANNLFAPYAGVLIQSLLDHAGKDHNYDIIIFNRDISRENQRLLHSLAAGHPNVSVRFYDPSPLFASFHYEERGWPIEVYYKIVAPHILNCPGRLITIDVDMLLKTDIARLKEEDLDGCCVGGVRDVIVNGMYLCDYTSVSKGVRERDYFQNVCGFFDLKNYVNSGLLLYEREQYIQEMDIETIFSTARQHSYLYPEQDVLNILLNGKIKHLDFSWNVLVPLQQRFEKLIEAGSKLFDGAYEDAYETPYILHWAARPKPWVCPDVPFGGEWWQTALRTPFVGHILARMTDAQETRRKYYKTKYGKEDVDIWDPSPKGINRQ